MNPKYVSIPKRNLSHKGRVYPSLLYGLLITFIIFFLLIPSSLADGIFAYSEWKYETYVTGGTELGSFSALPNHLYFNEISYYQNLKNIRTYASYYSIDGRAPSSATTSATLKDKGTNEVIGYASYTYAKQADSSMLLLLQISSWNISGLTGAKWVVIEYNTTAFYNFQFTKKKTVETISGDEKVYYRSYEVYPYRIVTVTNYIVLHEKYWRNDYQNKTINDYYLVNVTRNINSIMYPSTINLYTDISTYYNNYDICNISIPVCEIPIYLCIKDIYNNWHNVSLYLGEDTSAPRFYGVIREIKDQYTISGVNVSFHGANILTNDQGYYNIYDNSIGVYEVKLNKSGYQNRSYNIFYTPPLRHDTWLTREITPISETTSVYGAIFDNVTQEPLQNAFIKLYNSSFYRYSYSSESGYYEFNNLSNTSYNLIVEKSGYFKQMKEINLPDLDKAYYYPFYLTNITSPGGIPGPTPSPSLPERGIKTEIKNIFGMFGIKNLQEQGYIISLCVVALMVGLFGKFSKGNPIMCCIGGFFGFIISVGAGLLPRWMLALVIMVTMVGAVAIILKIGGK